MVLHKLPIRYSLNIHDHALIQGECPSFDLGMVFVTLQFRLKLDSEYKPFAMRCCRDNFDTEYAFEIKSS